MIPENIKHVRLTQTHPLVTFISSYRIKAEWPKETQQTILVNHYTRRVLLKLHQFC